jgi:hypothetical protein
MRQGAVFTDVLLMPVPNSAYRIAEGTGGKRRDRAAALAMARGKNQFDRGYAVAHGPAAV